MEEKRKQCSKCGKEKPINEFYRNVRSGDGHQYQCKVCDKIQATEHKRQVRLGLINPRKHSTMAIEKRWKKTNQKHYPDSEWVWTQLENGVTGKQLYDKMDKKYALQSHGNEGKVHTTQRHPWKTRKQDR